MRAFGFEEKDFSLRPDFIFTREGFAIESRKQNFLQDGHFFARADFRQKLVAAKFNQPLFIAEQPIFTRVR